MRLMISFAALFLSVILLQLGSGGVAPLDAISGVQLGFTTAEIGTLGSAHFLGFFIGCWWAPRLMGEVGHSAPSPPSPRRAPSGSWPIC
jgi:hypothetical protein